MLTGLSNSSNLKIQYAKPIGPMPLAALAHTPEFTPRSIQIYANDVVIKFSGQRPEHLEGTQRQAITQLSYKSLQKLAFTASNTNVVFNSLLTVTYPSIWPGDGVDVKRHLNKLLGCLRPTNSYLWFLEFQRRGAPHIHLLLTQHVTRKQQLWISQRWYKIVGSHDVKHLAAGTNWENVRKADGAKRYAIKYASKPEQKQVPADFVNVGRFWGCSRDVTPKMEREIEITRPRLIHDLLDGWEWRDRCKDTVKIRYNAAAIARSNFDTKLDNS